MAVIAEVDDEGSLNRVHSDPSVATIPGGLEPTHLVLKQQRDGPRVGVALDPKREVRLGAFWVEIYHHLLLHLHACPCHGFLLQPHPLRHHLHHLPRHPHQPLPVLLRHLPPPLRPLRPPRVVPALPRVCQVCEYFSPVQHCLSLLIITY